MRLGESQSPITASLSCCSIIGVFFFIPFCTSGSAVICFLFFSHCQWRYQERDTWSLFREDCLDMAPRRLYCKAVDTARWLSLISCFYFSRENKYWRKCVCSFRISPQASSKVQQKTLLLFLPPRLFRLSLILLSGQQPPTVTNLLQHCSSEQRKATDTAEWQHKGRGPFFSALFQQVRISLSHASVWTKQNNILWWCEECLSTMKALKARCTL